MNEPAVAHARNGLKNHGEFHLLPDAMKKWISASPSAEVDFHEFFSDGGKFEEVREVGLPFYRSEPRPSIIVDAEAWPRMSAPDALENPQWHVFGTLVHEICHHRFNATTVPFTGNTPQQYVQYRSELEGQAIFGAFRIFRELETVPPFDKQLPFNSIGYLNGIELGQLYKDWKAGRLDDAQAVAAISDKVADTPFRRSDPAPGKEGALTDRNGDGQLTHRDLYLRDFERIPRFHPQPDAPAVEPSALCASLPLPPKLPSSMYFLALSQAPPPVVMLMPTNNPVTIVPISNPPSASAPSSRPMMTRWSDRSKANVTPGLAASRL